LFKFITKLKRTRIRLFLGGLLTVIFIRIEKEKNKLFLKPYCKKLALKIYVILSNLGCMNKLHILLVDDDKDDCDIFKEALEELELSSALTILHNGIELLEYLSSKEGSYPDILFLDLNMPRKSGFECIKEMKSSTLLSSISTVIYSTSYNTDVVEELYDLGAHYYIQKPSSYKCLKKVIEQSIHLLSEENKTPISRANFVLKP
tara:strand:- start:2454 stop:3065 length:612 start_codon:yes stop_codon:yes gene_type:complete